MPISTDTELGITCMNCGQKFAARAVDNDIEEVIGGYRVFVGAKCPNCDAQIQYAFIKAEQVAVLK